MNTIAMYRNAYTIIYISGINSDKFPCVMSIHKITIDKKCTLNILYIDTVIFY